MPVPALLACARVHHALVATQKRTRAGLLVDTGEARDVHHFCTLIGYGADAVCPYMVYDALAALKHDGRVAKEETLETMTVKYIKVVPPAYAPADHHDDLALLLLVHARQHVVGPPSDHNKQCW